MTNTRRSGVTDGLLTIEEAANWLRISRWWKGSVRLALAGAGAVMAWPPAPAPNQ